MDSEVDPYPSRLGGEARLLERRDPVDHSNDPKRAPIAAAMLDAYARDGFLVVEPLFDAEEVRALANELDRLREVNRRAADDRVIREPESLAVRSIFEVHKASAVMARLACDAHLVDTARYLLGSEVYVHQSRLNYKPGFYGKEFFWHSDFETWHVEDGLPRMRTLSVSINLTDNLQYNGPLMLVPQSHLRYVSCAGETPLDHFKVSLKRQEYGVHPADILQQLVGEGGIPLVTAPAGTATFFDCNTMHGSNPGRQAL